jgi:hypothetical protein
VLIARIGEDRDAVEAQSALDGACGVLIAEECRIPIAQRAGKTGKVLPLAFEILLKHAGRAFEIAIALFALIFGERGFNRCGLKLIEALLKRGQFGFHGFGLLQGLLFAEPRLLDFAVLVGEPGAVDGPRNEESRN